MFAFICLIAISVANLTAANVMQHFPENCPKICPSLYAPVCGFNGKEYKEFSNDCELNIQNCEIRNKLPYKKPYHKTDMDWCTTTEVKNLKEKFDYLDFNQPNCVKPCPFMLKPVCISNGRFRGTVNHVCEMDMLNCVLDIEGTSAEFHILKEESC